MSKQQQLNQCECGTALELEQQLEHNACKEEVPPHDPQSGEGNITLFEPLPEGPFDVIYADPPWNYRGQVQHGGADKPFTSSASCFYETIEIEDLFTLPVKELRNPQQCILFMWATGPCLEDALALMKAWGFKYKQIAFVWAKGSLHKLIDSATFEDFQPEGPTRLSKLFYWAKRVRAHPDYAIIYHPAAELFLLVQNGKDQINPGAYTVTNVEYVLVGTHKRIPKPRGARNTRQFLQAPRTDHSSKPDEIARRIELMFPEQRKIELFARGPREGWTVWGKEVEEAA